MENLYEFPEDTSVQPELNPEFLEFKRKNDIKLLRDKRNTL